MKKLILALSCLLLFSNSTQARILQIGPRLGGGISWITIKAHTHHFSNVTPQLSYQFGVVGRVSLFFFYVQPEVLFTGTGCKFKYKNRSLKQRFNQLAIPVMVGISLLDFVRLQVGPVFSPLLRAREEGKNIKKNYKDFIWGYQAGLGIDLGNLLLDLKYEGNLMSSGPTLVGMPADHRPSQYILSIGYNLL